MYRFANHARQLFTGCILAVLAFPAQAAWELNMTQGVTTTCASKILHNYQPVYTATAVRQVWDDVRAVSA